MGKSMTNENSGTSPSDLTQIKIAMQQSEQAGQPIYANFSTVQSGQGVVIIDFCYLDSQTINAVNQMIKSGEKTPHNITANVSCRVAISPNAANQLMRQLGQLLHRKINTQTPIDQEKITQQEQTSTSSSNTPEKSTPSSNPQGGFRFPWSKKTH